MEGLQTDPLNLDAFVMSNGRQQPDDVVLHDPQSPLNSSSVLSAFSDFTMSYQNGNFTGPQMTSPQLGQGPFSQPHDETISTRSEGRNQLKSAHYRLNSNSPVDTKSSDLHGASMDGSDSNVSPGDGLSTGLNLLDDNNEGSSGAMDTGDADSMDHDSKAKGNDKSNTLPPWSDMKTKAGKERKRLPLACIACRRKKIRCSGEKPACKHCLRSRIPCVYKVTTRKAAPRTDYMAMLDKRLKRMEDRVIKLIPKENLSSIANVGRASVKPPLPGASSKAPNKKRPAGEAFGHELDEWSKAKTSSRNGASTKIPESDDSRLLTEGAESLPSREIQEHLAEVYFDYVYGQSYPLLHKPSFMRKLGAGTVPPVLILAVCAISARFSSHPQIRKEPAFLRGEMWAAPAREIALKRYDSPNVTILICYLLLGLHEFGTCQGGRSWMFGGMAQRMAYALQLQNDLEYDPLGGENGERVKLSPTDREIRRRTMWSCFLMDRFNSSGTDRPLFVSEQFIAAQLPIREHFYTLEISGPTETLDGQSPKGSLESSGHLYKPRENMGVIAYLIRVVTIWGKLIKYMNMGGKAKDPHQMWDPESTYQDLKNQATEWKTSLPDDLQYNEANLQTHNTERTANQFVYLHIMYWQTLLFMNRFALPLPPGARSETSPAQDFYAEAARTALEAAGQISQLVNIALDYNVVAPFAGYCAFFSSTVHIFGVFSKNPKLEAISKKYLAYNVKYLSKMKKYWGMLNFVAENLKELYRQHADSVSRGSSGANGSQSTTDIFQYGDWFNRYPHGVSRTDYEDPATDVRREQGTDAVLGQKSDLQSVEEFFASLSPPSKADAPRKVTRKGKHVRTLSSTLPKDSGTSGDANRRASPQQEFLKQQQQQQHRHALLTGQIPRLTTDGLNDPAFNQAYLSLSPHAQQQHHHHRAIQSAFPSDLAAQAATHTHFGSPHHHHHRHSSPLLDFSGQAAASFPSLDPTTANLLSAASPTASHVWPPVDFFSYASGFGPLAAEPGASWFMPFNVDPPTLGNDAGIFAGADFSFGFGFDGSGVAQGLGDEEPAASAAAGGSGGGADGGGLGDVLDETLQF